MSFLVSTGEFSALYIRRKCVCGPGSDLNPTFGPSDIARPFGP